MGELIKIFDYQAKTVRTVIKDGHPWFCAKDICEILELDNVGQVLSRLDLDEKDEIISNDVIGRQQKIWFVTESGLYSLTLSSRKPEAKEFKRWITHEILPQLRQTGSYSIKKKSDEEIILLGYEKLLGKVKLLETKVIEDKPKVEAFEAFMNADGLLDIKEVADALNFKGLGRNNLFELLRKEGILTLNNQPYRQYIEQGYFKTKTIPVQSGNREYSVPYVQTFATPKGMNWLFKLLNDLGYKQNQERA